MNEETKEKKAVFQYVRQLGPGLLLASAAEAPARVRPSKMPIKKIISK